MARGKGSRGGYRQPANPAPVSTPRSGARTDGGPGNARQPLRAANDQPYGARKATLDQQRAAPLAVAPSGPGAVGAGGGGGPAPVPVTGPPAIPPEGVFGPSNTPADPVSFGNARPMEEPVPAEVLLRLLYSKRPSPYIAKLLDNGRR